MPSGEKMHEYWEGYRAGRLHALFVGVHQAQNYHFQIDDIEELAGSESDKTYKAGYHRGVNSIIEQYLSENAKRFKN